MSWTSEELFDSQQ